MLSIGRKLTGYLDVDRACVELVLSLKISIAASVPPNSMAEPALNSTVAIFVLFPMASILIKGFAVRRGLRLGSDVATERSEIMLLGRLSDEAQRFINRARQAQLNLHTSPHKYAEPTRMHHEQAIVLDVREAYVERYLRTV